MTALGGRGAWLEAPADKVLGRSGVAVPTGSRWFRLWNAVNCGLVQSPFPAVRFEAAISLEASLLCA